MNSSLKSRYAFIFLAAIFILALAVRISPLLKIHEPARYGLGPFGDSYIYHVIAYNVYKGNGFSSTVKGPFFEPAITHGPGYPFFIAAIYRIWGHEKDMGSLQTWHKNWDKVRMVQCVLDATICIFVFFISWAISKGSFSPALISAILYCFSFYNIYYSKAVLTESFTTFLLTAALLLCIWGIKKDKWNLWAFSGIFFGLVILTRPEYLLFPFVLASYMMITSQGKVSKAVKNSLVFFIAAIIVVTPWTVRNYSVFKRFIPISVGGFGSNLFLGTCETNDNWQGWVELPKRVFDSKEERTQAQLLYDSNLEALRMGGIRVKDTDKALMGLALERIKKHPFECFKRWITKIPRLWYQFYIPMYRDKEASGGFFIFYFLFAIMALWKGTKEERELMAPIFLLFIYVTLIFLPLHIEPRYGVALMPGIICMASIGIWKFISQRYEAFK